MKGRRMERDHQTARGPLGQASPRQPLDPVVGLLRLELVLVVLPICSPSPLVVLRALMLEDRYRQAWSQANQGVALGRTF